MTHGNSRADLPTLGPWLVRGEAGPGGSAEAELLGIEPATDDHPGGWPYLIRPDWPLTPGGSLPHVAVGIQRWADARVMAAAPELVAALLRLLTAPDLLARSLDPATRQAVEAGWELLVRVAPYLEI